MYMKAESALIDANAKANGTMNSQINDDVNREAPLAGGYQAERKSAFTRDSS